MNAPDHELLERFLSAGDQAAFAELVRRHIGLVYSAANRITNRPVLAEEVSQIVFTKLARLTSMKPGLALVVWLHRITRAAAIDVVRTEMRRTKREGIAASLIMNEPSIPWERISPFLDEVIDRLSADERHVVLRRYFEGQSHAEIARSLGVSEDALRMRVSRALEKIRALLKKRGVTTSASALALVLPAHALDASVPAGLAMTVAAKAVASLTPSLTLIQIGIITMTKKSALIATAVLLLIGAGTALLIATRPKNPAATTHVGKSLSEKQSAGDLIASPPVKSGERPSQKQERLDGESELVAKYGDSRVRLAKRLTPSLLHLIGEDGIPAIAKQLKLNAQSKAEDMEFLTKTFELTEEERTKVAAVYDKVQARSQQEYRSDVAYLNSHSKAVTERLLAGDALKRGTISASEYESTVVGLDPRVMTLGGLVEWRSRNVDLMSLFGDEEFVNGLKASLDDPEWKAYVDVTTSGWAPDIAKAREPQPDDEISLSADRRQTLEEFDESLSNMNKFIDGAKGIVEAVDSLRPPQEATGGK